MRDFGKGRLMYLIVAQKDHLENDGRCKYEEEYEYVVTHIFDTLEEAREQKKQCDAFWRVGKPIIFQEVE